MKRILLAFGDSHTSGAEIDEQYSGFCYERAYPAHIARHYGFDYENFAIAGASNDWMIRQFMIRVQHSLMLNQQIFVLCNFCEPSRTYIKFPEKIQHCTPSLLLQNENTKKELLVDSVFIKPYKNYLRTHTEEALNFKSLSQVFIIQSICQQYNIPYVFHTSTHWYSGNWNLINKKNYFGHHATKKLSYKKSDLYHMWQRYSYWGIAMHHPDWAHLQKTPRWSMHYPESFHEFWAKILIDFIDNQGILDKGI